MLIKYIQFYLKSNNALKTWLGILFGIFIMYFLNLYSDDYFVISWTSIYCCFYFIYTNNKEHRQLLLKSFPIENNKVIKSLFICNMIVLFVILTSIFIVIYLFNLYAGTPYTLSNLYNVYIITLLILVILIPAIQTKTLDHKSENIIFLLIIPFILFIFLSVFIKLILERNILAHFFDSYIIHLTLLTVVLGIWSNHSSYKAALEKYPKLQF
ncbi:hypothetical protein EDC18_102191 [Natranaerovirga pectinivora]|uniref:ABC-2 family transporter n=1 Tax=Natranaerovirga pectinivora TaxID=682400 RepID=A0A4R3MMJ5_9FIRM|nr:ABC-2 transporter permease [Natranaerovirga pectinivora]TCT16175.1 hypothetical protein EDC18_102191 [Natranaerovirga pectinivora]